jgi:hypothetical protein
MTIVVESGSGDAGSESYISVAELDTYVSGRNYSYTDTPSTAAKEGGLRLATEYIDTNYRFNGTRLLSTQALEFPRDGLTDWSSMEITGVPARVKNATAELAFRVANGEVLFSDLQRAGMVKSESVGPISVTYMDGAPAGTSFIAVDRALSQYVRDTKAVGAPYYNTDAVGSFFDFDMTANPPSPTDD